MNDKIIKIDCDIKKIEEKKDNQGNIISRSSSQRHFSKVLQTPPNTDVNKAEIENDKDEITISLPKIS